MLQDAALLRKSSCLGGQEPSSLGTSRAGGGTECPDALPEPPQGWELSQGWSTQWELSILPSLSLPVVPCGQARPPLFVPFLKINHFGMNSMPVNNASPAMAGM